MMKKFLLFAALVCMCSTVSAQKTSQDYAYVIGFLQKILTADQGGEYQQVINLTKEFLTHSAERQYADTLKQEMYALLAKNHFYLHQYDPAIEYGKKVLQIENQIHGDDTYIYLYTLRNMVLYYYNGGYYEKTIATGLDLMGRLEKSHQDNDREYAYQIRLVSKSYESLRDYSNALLYGEKTLRKVETLPDGDDSDKMKLLEDLGFYCYSLKKFTSAIKYTLEAADIQKGLKGVNNDKYMDDLDFISLYYSFLGDYANAIKYRAETLKIKARVYGTNDIEYAKTLIMLANYYSMLGNYNQAIKYETDAAIIIKNKSGIHNVGYIIIIWDLCKYYKAKGYYVEAYQLHQQVKPLLKDIPDFKEVNDLNILGKLAEIYKDDENYQKALEVNSKILKIQENMFGSEDPDCAMTLKNIAIDYQYLNRGNDAVYALWQALYILRSVDETENANYLGVLVQQPYVYYQVGNYYQLTESLKQLYHRVQKYLMNGFKTMTETERRYLWQGYRHVFTSDIPYWNYRHNTFALNCLCYDAMLMSKELLLNSNVNLYNLLMESGNKDVIRDYQTLQANYKLLHNLYEQPSALRTVNADSLETASGELERNLVSESKTYGDFTNNMKVGWEDVQKQLGDHDVAIEFMNFHVYGDTINKTEYAAMVLRKGMDCPQMVDLCGTAKLCFYQTMYEYDGGNEIGQLIYDLVWKKLEPYLHEGDDVYFSPSGLLYQMNIEALQDSAGRMVNEKYHLYRLSTTRELCYKKEAHDYKSAALYGGLNYNMDVATMADESRKYQRDAGNSTACRGYALDSLSRGTWRELPQTKIEVESVATVLEKSKIAASVIEGADGTEESFKALSGKRTSIIHLATHGFFLTDDEIRNKKYFRNVAINDRNFKDGQFDTSMKRSGLIFSGGQNAWLGKDIPDNVEDGILLAEEIPSIDLRGTDLLVLSACNTGLGDISSEGVYGLQRGFKQAGVKTILMSLWPVDDKATQMLMDQFYRHLTAGQSKTEALRNAQSYLRSNGFSNSKYWASFIMLDGM